MLPILRDLCSLTIVTASLLFSCLPAYAQTDKALQVLILNSYDEGTAPYFLPRDAFMLELQKELVSPIAFRQFDLEHRRENTPDSLELKAQLLQNEYASSPPDLVVAIGPPASVFWLSKRDPMFSSTPFIATAADFSLRGLSFRPGDVAVATPFSFLESIEDYLGLQPDTSHIVMVFGSSPDEKRLVKLAKTQLEPYSSRINFEYTSHMKLTEVLHKISTLQPGSAVFFGIYDSDVDGVLLDHYSGLNLVRSRSSVPVFGAFDNQLGKGILGGRLIQLEKMGKEIAVTAQEVLRNRPSDFVWKSVGMSKPTYDWNQLKAWGIDPDRIPDGSVIRFKPPSIWEEHAGWVLFAVIVVSAQMVLIASVLLANRRRRRAELANSQLGRRLISAQEDERRLLARELHDDLSQRLARLAIDTSYVAANQGSDTANEVLEKLQPELVRISKDVHDMSYRLHPSLIDDLGLVAALKTECERMCRYTDSNIVEQIDEIQQRIPADLALSLYRITQEALNNAVKYADADTIEVTLKHEQQSLLLTVHDNGSGFDITPETAQSGLGLSSMRERAQLSGGSWEIRSQPGKGTTVNVVAPLGGVAR